MKIFDVIHTVIIIVLILLIFSLFSSMSEIKKENYDIEKYLTKDIIKRYDGWDYF